MLRIAVDLNSGSSQSIRYLLENKTLFTYVMARYFFHIHNDVSTLDEEGTEFADNAAALAAARKYSLNLACHSVATHGHLILHHRIEVQDANGLLVGNVTFGEVVDVRP